MPAPKSAAPSRTAVVVVKPPPVPMTKVVDAMPFAPIRIRKTVAPVAPAVAPEPKEPRPPKAVTPTPVTPTPFMQDPGRVPGPTPGLDAPPTPVVSTGVKFRPGGVRNLPPYVKGLRTEATPKIAPRYSPKAQRVGHKKKAAAAKSAKAFTPAAVKAVAKK